MTLKSTDVLPLDYITSTAEYKRAAYFVIIPKRFKFEQILIPEFWRHATMLKTALLNFEWVGSSI